MLKKGKLPALITLLSVVSYFLATDCNKDVFDSSKSGEIIFSSDTILFDTVFTNFATPVKRLIVHNPNNYIVKLDSIFLAGRNTSAFRVNINGIPFPLAKNLLLNAKDSMYIFVSANIPATTSSEPFITEDSLIFVSGGNVSHVNFWAAGQNTVVLNNQSIKTQEWTNTKPYLIIGTLTVDSAETLKIREGVRVFLHKNASILVKGLLHVYGTHDKPVFFKGDRLDSDYDSIPGQWGAIQLSGTNGLHVIEYANIRNGTIGIQAGDYLKSNHVSLQLSNSVISNMGYSCILAYSANINARNCVIANSKDIVCNLLNGGSYQFTHCTLANYGARYVMHDSYQPCLQIQNYYSFLNKDGKTEIVVDDLQSSDFRNSIIYGNTSSEVVLNSKPDKAFSYTFQNCLVKISGNITNDTHFIKCIVNKTPAFLKPQEENFHLDTLSNAKDAGDITIANEIPYDLDNNSRLSDNAPDIGAYERKEK